MNRIKKRLKSILTNLMLVENEIARLKIMKKEAKLDEEDIAMLTDIRCISNRLIVET